MQPLNPHAQTFIPERHTLSAVTRTAANPKLSFKEQLIEIGMLDSEGRLTFVPETVIPEITTSDESERRLNHLLHSPIPLFNISVSEYVLGWNEKVNEALNIPIITYLRGSYLFYILDLPKMLELLIQEYTQGVIDCEEPLQRMREKWLEETPPTDIDLLDLCAFDNIALTFLTKRHLADISGLSILEIEQLLQKKLIFPNKPRPLYPPPQDILILTLGDHEKTLDRVSGNPAKLFMFSRDDASLVLTGGFHYLVCNGGNFWQTVIDRLFHQIRFNNEHENDFQAGLTCLQKLSNHHTLHETPGSLHRCLSQVANLDKLDPLVNSIRNRIKRHQAHPIFFLLNVCQKLEPFLSQEDIEIVYQKVLEIIPSKVESTFKEAIASFHAIATLFLCYQAQDSSIEAVIKDSKLILTVETVQLQFKRPECGPIHEMWIAYYLDLNKLRYNPDFLPPENLHFGHPVLDLLISRARQKPMTPFSQTFLQNLERVCSLGLMNDALAALLLPLLEIYSPFNAFSMALTLSKKGYKREAREIFRAHFQNSPDQPAIEDLEMAWKSLDKKSREEFFKELLENQKLSLKAQEKFYPLLIENPTMDFWKQRKSIQWIKDKNYPAFFQNYPNALSHPLFDQALDEVVKALHSQAIFLLLKTNEKALHNHFDTLFQNLISQKKSELALKILKNAESQKHTGLFYQKLFQYLPELPIEKLQAQTTVKSLLNDSWVLENIEDHEHIIQCLLIHEIRAPKPLKFVLKPLTIAAYRTLEKLGYFPDAEARDEVLSSLVENCPETFCSLNNKEKEQCLKLFKNRKEQAQRLVDSLSDATEVSIDLLLKTSNALHCFPVAIRQGENSVILLNSLIKHNIKGSQASGSWWHYALEEFLRNPRPLKELELSLIIDTLVYAYPNPKEAIEVSYKLMPFVNTARMERKSFTWALMCLDQAFKNPPHSEELSSFYKKVIESLITKIAYVDLLEAAAYYFYILPPSEENTALLLKLLKQNSIVYEGPFYECFKVQSKELSKPEILKQVVENLNMSKRALQLGALLSLWAREPSVGETLQPKLMNLVLFHKWKLHNHEGESVNLFYAAIQELMTATHGQTDPLIRFIFHYLALIKMESIETLDFIETLKFLSEVCSRAEPSRRIDLYGDFTQFVKVTLNKQLTVKEIFGSLLAILKMISVIETKTKNAQLDIHLVPVLCALLDSFIQAPLQIFRTESLKILYTLFSQLKIPPKTVDNSMPLFEKALALALSAGDLTELERFQNCLSPILLNENFKKSPKECGTKFLSLAYWGLGMTISVNGQKLSDWKFSEKILYQAILTLLNYPTYECMTRLLDIFRSEAEVIAKLNDSILTLLISQILRELKNGRRLHRNATDEWEDLIMNFALDVFTEYPYEQATTTIQDIQVNEVLPTDEMKFLTLTKIFNELKKMPS